MGPWSGRCARAAASSPGPGFLSWWRDGPTLRVKACCRSGSAARPRMMMATICVPSLPWPRSNPSLPRRSFDDPGHTSGGASKPFVAHSIDVALPRPANTTGTAHATANPRSPIGGHRGAADLPGYPQPLVPGEGDGGPAAHGPGGLGLRRLVSVQRTGGVQLPWPVPVGATAEQPPLPAPAGGNGGALQTVQ